MQANADKWTHLLTLGVVYYRLQRYRQAAELIERAASANPEAGSASCFLFLAMAHHGLGNHDKAQTTLQQALGWMESHPEKHRLDLKEQEKFRQEAEELLKRQTPNAKKPLANTEL